MSQRDFILLFNNVYIFIGALHMEFLARVLLQIFIIFQMLKHRAILRDSRLIQIALILHLADAVIDANDGDQIAHNDNSRVNKHCSC